MKRILSLLGVWLVLCAGASAQTSRVEGGVNSAGDTGGGIQGVSTQLTGRIVFRFGANAIDFGAGVTVQAPQSVSPSGHKIATDIVLRRYVFAGVYIAAGVDVNELHLILSDAVATSAITGVGLEVGSFRVQGYFEPHDFTSQQGVSMYRVEGEYVQRIRGRDVYIAFKPALRVSRFQPEDHSQPDIIAVKRVGITISFGRFF